MTNCPNCGAPIVSHKCEYCGTIFSKPAPDNRYVSCKEIELLESMNACLKQQVVVKELCMSALKAMRSYGG